MLDITLIREHSNQVKEGFKAKNADPKLVDAFLELDEKWRSLTKQFDEMRAEQRKLGEARKVDEAKVLKEEIKKLEDELSNIEKLRQETLRQMPNLPLPSVPIGENETDNQVIREVGEKPKLKSPKEYLALAQRLDLIDVEHAAAASGSRFGYLKGAAALLEFALIDLAMKTLVREGFTPIVPPVMVRPSVMEGMGKVNFIQGGDAFYLPQDNLYLVGSSEHSLGSLHADDLFAADALPKRYVAFSTCFRREAGSYGKDTKGILRVHQFDKVEMFSFATPEQSDQEHQFLLSLQERLMQALQLPYRVMEICTGDMGWTDARQFDIETWLPGQNGGKGEYRETHSTSNTTDFQARGLNIKYKNAGGTSDFAHMLNGTAFAIGRTLIAIFENYQTSEGTIRVPQALQAYCGFAEIR